jgi:hypothetical protein
MARKSAPTRRRRSSATAPSSSEGRELVVITSASAGLRAGAGALASASGASVSALTRLLSNRSATLVPVFGNEERVLRARSLAVGAPELPALADLTRYYLVQAPADSLEQLQQDLLNDPLVDGAYIQPAPEPAVVMEMPPALPDEAPPATPDFNARQLYLDAAPGGIGARSAWSRPGARGTGVRVIDIEGAWRFGHEDLIQNQGGVIGGTQSTDIGWRNHGTAVVGVFGGDQNAFGVTGIAPEANTRAISIFGTGQSSAKAITDAANALSPGDIILIELHAPGPRFNFQATNGQRGFIAMEFWPANFAAILHATQVRGVIVIEAAGNGAENYDDPLYNTRPTGFPSTWSNPFNLSNPQSGAILVGAGAPPPGTHGRDHGPDRSRLDFSNFGARVDVQGWGREVTTCGYGDLQGGSNEDLWYTDTFSGTSSASPVVVGAVASLQGALRARSRPLLTPATATSLLRSTGSPQQDAPGRPATQRIGNRPDLEQALRTLGLGKGIVKDVKDKDKTEIKEKAETKEAKDLKEQIKEKIETKESKDQIKDLKEKERKEFTKDIKEKDLRDVDPKRFEFPAPGGPSVDDRLAGLEQAVSHLLHFIGASDRPDLQQSALHDEADVAAQLARQAQDAKRAKDDKDVEKGRES